MKILLYTDNHFCENASIVNKMGAKFSVRLENQIKSIHWTEDLAVKENCDAIFCLGDFFDKQSLTDQEITALRDINFNHEVPHTFLVGNHESEEIDLKYSSTQILRDTNFKVIDRATSYTVNDTELCLLPYITDRNITSIKDIFGEKSTTKRIIFSHNDIAGIQMGSIVSKSGFNIKDIEENCDLFLNGHLHNGVAITEKVRNLGNLTGKDFGENAFIYKHSAFILDTDTLQLTEIENPYAFNFYQLNCSSQTELSKINNLKDNAVLRLNCPLSLVPQAREMLDKYANKIVASKIVVVQSTETGDEEVTADLSSLSIDYLAELCSFCKSKIGSSEILDYELAQICK